MKFNDADVRSNSALPLSEVRVGCTSDARWRFWLPLREVLDGVEISSLRIHEANATHLAYRTVMS